MAGEDFQTSMMAWLFIVIGFYPIIALTAGNLLVFDGTNDVTNRVLVSEINGCLSSFNDTSLSNELKGLSIDKPRYLKVSFNDEQNNSLLYGGAIFEWASPVSEVGVMFLKGFYVEIDGEISADSCSLYVLNNTGFEDKPLIFKLNMETFSNRTDDFTVRVYSIPASDKSRHETRAFEFLYLRTEISDDTTNLYPREWSPTIAYKPLLENRSVDVFFSLPPKRENRPLMQFNVMLLSCPDRNKLNESQARNTRDSETFWKFPKLQLNDFYSVVVKVESYNESLCICQRKFGICDNSCGLTESKGFSLSGNPTQPNVFKECELKHTTQVYPSSSSSTPDSKIDITKHNASSEGDDSKTVVIIVATLVPFVILVLVCLAIAYYCCKKRQDKDQFTENSDILAQTEIIMKPPVKIVKDLQHKTVYIVASSDHPEAVDLIKSLCAFLKAHCQCDVINPSDFNLNQSHESVWVTSKMSISDIIIFVNSRGTAKLLDIYLYNKESDLDPSQSVTFKALQFSFISNIRSKCIIVTFNHDWIKDKLAILNPKNYHLPKQLPHFLCGLHNLSATEAENYKDKLPLNMEYVGRLIEWQPFLEAIKKVEIYEENRELSSETENENDKSSPSTRPLKKGPLSVSMTDIPEQSSAEPPYPESAKDPDSDGEGNIYTPTDVPSNISFGPLDGLSFVTVGKASDIQSSANKDLSQAASIDKQLMAGSQSAQCATNYDPNCSNAYGAGDDVHETHHPSELNQTFSDGNLKPKVIKPLPPLIIPPRGTNINLSEDDSLSNVISKCNDNLSVWSNKPGYGTIDQKDNKEQFEKTSDPVNRLRTVKPPPNFIPTDNISARLQALNENDNTDTFGKLLCELPENDVNEISV